MLVMVLSGYCLFMSVLWRMVFLYNSSLANSYSQADPRPYRGAPKAHRSSIRRTLEGFVPRRHLRPTAGRAIPVPYPPRATAHTEMRRRHDRINHRGSPLGCRQEPWRVDSSLSFMQRNGSSLGRVERADYAITFDMIPERVEFR
jgi:hypothetical protein